MAPPPPDLREAGGGGVTATRRQAALGTAENEVLNNSILSTVHLTEQMLTFGEIP